MLLLSRFLFVTALSVGATYGCSKPESPSGKEETPPATKATPLVTMPTVLPVLDRNVEPRRTITQGLYGQTTEQDDVGPPRPPRVFPMSLSVFASGKRTKPIAEVTSDETGFYQIPLDAGVYDACTAFGRCRQFRVARGDCVRLDYEFSVGPGWSLAKSGRCATPP